MKLVQTSDARCLPGAAAAGALLIAAMLPAGTVIATPVVYEIDPNHTHPMFEADHYGTSVWRGLFRKTRGTITLDVTKGTGTVDIWVDTASIEFGNEELNDVAANASAPPSSKR